MAIRIRLALSAAVLAVRLRRVRGVTDTQTSLHIAFEWSSSLAPAQVRAEIVQLMELLNRLGPSRVVEIGTGRGGTLFLLSRSSAEDAQLLSVDLPGAAFGAGYTFEWLPVLKAIPRKAQRLRLLRGDSHAQSTLEQVTSWLGGKPLDFILIDGDHTYEGARHDFETYGELVRPGGLIALHDIVPGIQEKVGGVPRLWKELRDRFSVRELVNDWEQGGWGIGVVEVPPDGIARNG